MLLKKLKRVTVLLIALAAIVIPMNSVNYITPLSPPLGIGSKGSEVAGIQQRLKNWGYYEGVISGEYNIETSEAVSSFQKKYGLPETGIASGETLIEMGLSTITSPGSAYAQGSGTSEEQLLARAINGEARGEPYEGQVAVGAVILNRTKDSKFPKTIAGVIYQPGAFTAVSDGQINVAIDKNSTIVKAARDALNGWDPTDGCLYYWNPATATSKWIWSRKIVKKIGKHNFGI